MYSVEVAYEVEGKIRKEMSKCDFINEAIEDIRLKVNSQIPKGRIVAIIVLRED
jgi:hypothetical protein